MNENYWVLDHITEFKGMKYIFIVSQVQGDETAEASQAWEGKLAKLKSVIQRKLDVNLAKTVSKIDGLNASTDEQITDIKKSLTETVTQKMVKMQTDVVASQMAMETRIM